MTPLPFQRSVFFLLASGAALAGAHAAPVALTPPFLSTHVLQISAIPDGNLCIVGETMDPDGDLQSRGKVIVFSPARNKVLWQQTVDAPDDHATSNMVACRADGKFIYVAANVETHTERSLSQALAYVYKFDRAGKQLAVNEIVTGATNTFAYDLDIDGNGVHVVGMTSNGKSAKKANGMYLVRLDGNLKPSNMSRLATGAYQYDALVRLSNNVALFGGNFLPAESPDTANLDYAVSKIVGGKYQFSVRPQKGKLEQAATAFAGSGEIVSLGYVGNTSTLTVVGADGKAAPAVPVKSALCATVSMSAQADTVLAIRKSCTSASEAARLVAIDRKTGLQTVKAGITGEPVFVFPLDAKIYVVSRKDDNTLLFQSLGKGD